jgi:hypothetical protein
MLSIPAVVPCLEPLLFLFWVIMKEFEIIVHKRNNHPDWDFLCSHPSFPLSTRVPLFLPLPPTCPLRLFTANTVCSLPTLSIMSTGGPGRPAGTQNKPGHAAGGSRPGAGRPSTGHQSTGGPSLPRETIPGESLFCTSQLCLTFSIYLS